MKRNQAHITNQTIPIELPEPTEADIQKEAYYEWIESGRPEGRDLDIWHAAKERLRHRHEHPHPSALASAHSSSGHEV